MKAKTILRNQSGASFLEVLCATAIIVPILSISMLMARYGNQLHYNSQHRIQASLLAESTINMLMMAPSDSAARQAGDHNLYFDIKGKTTTQDKAYFVVSWTVTPDTPVSGVSEVELKVEWTANKTTRSLNLATNMR